MSVSVEVLFARYERMLKTYEYLSYAGVLIMVLGATWFLWIPKFNSQFPFSALYVFLGAVILLVIGFTLALRLTVETNSGMRYLLYLLVFGGVFLQNAFDINLIYIIPIVTFGAILKSLVDPLLNQIERTQHFASSTKVNEEIVEAIRLSYIYYVDRRKWIFKMLFVALISGIIGIIGIFASLILPYLISPTIIQFSSLAAILILFFYLIFKLFLPNIDNKGEQKESFSYWEGI